MCDNAPFGIGKGKDIPSPKARGKIEDVIYDEANKRLIINNVWPNIKIFEVSGTLSMDGVWDSLHVCWASDNFDVEDLIPGDGVLRRGLVKYGGAVFMAFVHHRILKIRHILEEVMLEDGSTAETPIWECQTQGMNNSKADKGWHRDGRDEGDENDTMGVEWLVGGGNFGLPTPQT